MPPPSSPGTIGRHAAWRASSRVSGSANSHWYLYQETNFGAAVGFFANANHMASLLVIALPFAATSPPRARPISSAIPRCSRCSSAPACSLGRNRAQWFACRLCSCGSGAFGQRADRHPAGKPVAAGAVGVALLALQVASARWRQQDWPRPDRCRDLGPDARWSCCARPPAPSPTLCRGSGLGSFPEGLRSLRGPGTVTDIMWSMRTMIMRNWRLKRGSGHILLLAFLAWWARPGMAVGVRAE